LQSSAHLPIIPNNMSGAPRTYVGELAKLERLETFDPAASAAPDKATQDAAEFVLALALAFNDMKDLLFAESLLHTQKPSDLHTPTRAPGMFSEALPLLSPSPRTSVRAALCRAII
jgi:hypothetical protein